MDLRYRLLNVFSVDGSPFSGNPLCVFEDASGLDDEQMQAWARQFNLSETTFVTATGPDRELAEVRIFTASYEMPFAGHPTLGTAQVVADLAGDLDAVELSMKAGVILVRRIEGGWQLRANAATARDMDADPADLANALGIPGHSLVPRATAWVDAGVEQFLIQLDSAEAVRACTPDAHGINEHTSAEGRQPQVYVWAWTGQSSVEARMFAVSGTVLDEDPATGSAAANLGGWFVLQGLQDLEVVIEQGAQVGRPSRLVVTIDGEGTVFVGGAGHGGRHRHGPGLVRAS